MTYQADLTKIKQNISKTERFTVAELMEKILEFTPYTNNHGEKIFLANTREMLLIATGDFKNFFPVRETNELERVALSQSGNRHLVSRHVPGLVEPEEFLWLFDTYGLAEAMENVVLPTDITIEDLLVPADLKGDIHVTSDVNSDLFVKLLGDVQRQMQATEKTFVPAARGYRDEYIRDNTGNQKESSPFTNRSLDQDRWYMKLESAVMSYSLMLVEDEEKTFIYVPDIDVIGTIKASTGYLTTNGRSGVKLLELEPEMADVFIGFLSSGYIKNVVKTFLEYRKLKAAGKGIYQHFSIVEIGGKEREIHAPTPELNDPLKGLAKVLSAYYESTVKGTSLDKIVTGFRPGKSIKDNVSIHKKNKYSIKCDIKSFFKCVRFQNYQRYIEFLINPNKIAGDSPYTRTEVRRRNLQAELMEVFRDILVEDESMGLYMGNPLSPVLTNLVMRKVVRYVDNVIQSINSGEPDDRQITFSIYADDLTFSSPTYDGESYFTIKFLTSLVDSIFDEMKLYNLHLNKDKSVRMVNNRRLITGLRINHEDEVTVPRWKYETLRSILHRLHVTQDLNSLTMEPISIQSRLAFYRYVDESGKISRLIEKYKEDLDKFGIKVGSKDGYNTGELIEFLNKETN